jgi:DnaJ-class molecular chaperone
MEYPGRPAVPYNTVRRKTVDEGKCPSCGSENVVEPTCPICDGVGEVEFYPYDNTSYESCDECGGSGWSQFELECEDCGKMWEI